MSSDMNHESTAASAAEPAVVKRRAASRTARNTSASMTLAVTAACCVLMMSIVSIYIGHVAAKVSMDHGGASALPRVNSVFRSLPTDCLLITVDQNMVYVDNRIVVSLEDVRNTRDGERHREPIIQPLEDKLRSETRMEEEMIRMGLSGFVKSCAIIAMDKNIDFEVLYRVMYTCSYSKYYNIHFAVKSGDTGESAGIYLKASW